MSLTGRILPIVGVKEKLLAARRSDVKTVLYPEDNRKDYDELKGALVVLSHVGLDGLLWGSCGAAEACAAGCAVAVQTRAQNICEVLEIPESKALHALESPMRCAAALLMAAFLLADDVKEGIQAEFVKTYDDVYRHAFDS